MSTRRNTVSPIHFFKIITETNVERTKLPNQFTRSYGLGLPNPVCLRTPDSIKWKVYWTEENGGIWVEKGWNEFVKYYSMHNGHFILFKYGGTSLIDVVIFDQSAVEIDYYFFNYDNASISEFRLKSPLVSEKMPSGTNGNVKAISHFGQVKKSPIKNKSKEVKAVGPRKSLNRPRERRAREVAGKFVSNNLFFTVAIKQDQLEKRSGTKSVPRFLDAECKEQNVMLQIGKKSWIVKYVSAPIRAYAWFATGWKLFTRESKLQDGDICIFELINQLDVPLLKVHVTKAGSS